MSHLLVTYLVIILCSLKLTTGEKVYYIIPDATESYNRSHLVLSQFAANSSNYLHSNTTLVFLPGTHYLTTVNLSLSNVNSFVMKSKNSTARIKCTSYSHVHFNHSQYIRITNLEFIGCGGNQIVSIEEFVIEDASFKGQENSETALEIIGTTAKIVDSIFACNTKGSHRCVIFDHKYVCSDDGFVGGALIATNSTISVSQSRFEYNSADFGGAIFLEQHSIITVSGSAFIYNNATDSGGGLYSSSSSITITRTCEFHGNSATVAGGVLGSHSSTVTIEASKFHDNHANTGGVLSSLGTIIAIDTTEFRTNSGTNGGVLSLYYSTVTIDATVFHDNSATTGGVLDSFASNVTVERSKFHTNHAKAQGGIIHSFSGSIVVIEASKFHKNIASRDGGILHTVDSTIIIGSSEFHTNHAAKDGGVLHSSGSTVTIDESNFHSNNANYRGGVLFSRHGSAITIGASNFCNNSAMHQGGVLHTSNSTITIGGSYFVENDSPIGAVIYALLYSIIKHSNYLLIENNSASKHAVIYLSDSELRGYDSENFTFLGNLGSLVAFNSNIIFTGYAKFVNNQPSLYTTSNIQEGGVVTLFQSNIFFYGKCNFEHNWAENGGAIQSTDSKLHLNWNVNLTIAHNTAISNGGGVYLMNSELNCQRKSTFVLYNNTAAHKGGGLLAISSSIKTVSVHTFIFASDAWQYTGTRINFTKNTAKRGGGLSLEANAKLYIFKYGTMYVQNDYDDTNGNTAVFTANSADYGGAVYVDDDTNSGTCASDTNAECFFQVLAFHGQEHILKDLETQSIYFSRNYANVSGSTLYGGLLDRCAISQFAEVRKKFAHDFKNRDSGIAYFKNVSNSTLDHDTKELILDMEANISVSSDPVRMCLCINNEPECALQNHDAIKVKKGEIFTVSLVAVDQVGKPVHATIQTSLMLAGSGLAEGQLARKIPAKCTDLTFNVVSPYTSENLTVYALDGPCKDADLSKETIEIHFLPCSCLIGLQISGMNKTNCTCECHSDIKQYVGYCDPHTGSFVKQQPKFKTWISYINDTKINVSGYLVYPNCPFDYCLSTSPPINLNLDNGADAQCSYNRSSLLCGSCRPGLSLSLGSSLCLPCPSYWPALLIAITIAAILAGIALVTLLLVLNMTVAVGTLNGLIFYVNVVHTSKSTLLPFERINIITVFISWLNLEVGFDICYFPGMDTYIKTWLQIAFPVYIILLVVLVIIISSYSSKFANLIGKKNPVATLATLILLSYAKLLEICFKSLSVGSLKYPDGSSEIVWLPDATVRYLSGKHIPLFIVAILILLIGVVYTALLFSWQWLLYLPKWKIFRWSRNPKVQTFIETYHKPYTPKHRYWTGLLLVARIILYLVSAVNYSNKSTIALTAICFIMCCILILRQFIGSRTYRKWPVDVLETVFYLNILIFAIFVWYSLDDSDSNLKETVPSTSVIVALIALLLIVLYHVYAYTSIFSRIKKRKPGRMIDRLFAEGDPCSNPQRHWSSPPDDDIHRFNELLDTIDRPVNTNDYHVPLRYKPVEPTQSVVEVHHPYLAPSDPKEADTQHL